MTLVLSDDDVQQAFDWGLAIEALRAVYAGADDTSRYPNRTVARGGPNWLRTLSGIPADGSPMGAKIIAGAFARRLVSYLISLVRPGHGRARGADGRALDHRVPHRRDLGARG